MLTLYSHSLKKKEKNWGTNIWVTKNTREAPALTSIFGKPWGFVYFTMENTEAFHIRFFPTELWSPIASYPQTKALEDNRHRVVQIQPFPKYPETYSTLFYSLAFLLLNFYVFLYIKNHLSLYYKSYFFISIVPTSHNVSLTHCPW